MKHANSKKVFKTRETKIWNWVLLSLLIFFIIGIMDFFPPEFVVLGALGWTISLILVWYLWGRQYFRIEIFNGKVSGPSGNFQRMIMPVHEVDLEKLAQHTDFKKKVGRYSIESRSGKVIYMYSRLLSPKQMEKISMKIQDEISRGTSLFK